MGAVKQGLIDEMEAERFEEATEWLEDKLGRPVTEAEVLAAWEEFELAEAFEHAMDNPNA